MKKIVTVLFVICISFAIPAFAAETVENTIVEEENMQDDDANVGSGMILNQTDFQKIDSLTEDNGKYVNFYIENIGDIPIQITINGKQQRIIQPNGSGHISIEVKNNILGKAKKYTFKAVSAKDGGDISMKWRIAQREEQ